MKTSTTTLDEMYRQMATLLAVPSGYDNNLLLGGSESSDDSDSLRTLEEFLIDLE
jgi:hypothetical protein